MAKKVNEPKVETKTCKKCGETKPLTEWYPYLKSWCKSCEIKRSVIWHREHRLASKSIVTGDLVEAVKKGKAIQAEVAKKAPAKGKGLVVEMEVKPKGLKKAKIAPEPALVMADVLPQPVKKGRPSKEALAAIKKAQEVAEQKAAKRAARMQAHEIK